MNNPIYDSIRKQGMLPLFFYPDVTVSREILKALYAAGIRVVEYTNRGKEAFDNFKQLLNDRAATMPDLLLGIGTIKSSSEANKYLDAGADFLISPCYSLEIQKVCDQRKAIWIPGCMTPSEINQAEQNGIGFIKLFPGNILQPAFMSAIKDLFPNTFFMPTGGVDLDEDNMRSWFDSGVSAVGMGSKLISRKSMENKDYLTISELTKEALRIIQSIKS